MKNSISSVIAIGIALVIVLLSGEMCSKSQRVKTENFKAVTNGISAGNGPDEAAQTKDIGSFFQEILGEWIGTAKRSTNGKIAGITYFHGVVRQTNPRIYQIVIEHFKLDKKTRELVRIGKMVMTVTIISEETARNSIIDTSVVFLNPNTSKPENALLSETLRISPSGSLEGSGSGKISVQGTDFNAGKNGKVSEYTSTWILDNGILSITERLKVTFHAMAFSKHYQIVNYFKAQRGNNIMSLIKSQG